MGLLGAWQGFLSPRLLGSRQGSAKLNETSSGLSRAQRDLVRAGGARRDLTGLPGSSSPGFSSGLGGTQRDLVRA